MPLLFFSLSMHLKASVAELDESELGGCSFIPIMILLFYELYHDCLNNSPARKQKFIFTSINKGICILTDYLKRCGRNVLRREKAIYWNSQSNACSSVMHNRSLKQEFRDMSKLSREGPMVVAVGNGVVLYTAPRRSITLEVNYLQFGVHGHNFSPEAKCVFSSGKKATPFPPTWLIFKKYTFLLGLEYRPTGSPANMSFRACTKGFLSLLH